MPSNTILKTWCITVLLFMCCSWRAIYAQQAETRLTGRAIGSYPYYDFAQSQATTQSHDWSCAFDGDNHTYYAASTPSMGWVGLDLGSPHVITKIEVVPRAGGNVEKSMMLGLFEGANDSTFMDAIPLFIIKETPNANLANYYPVQVSRGVRYVRYVGPSSSHAALAELAFYGHAGKGNDSRFYQVTNLPTVSIHVQENQIPTIKGMDFVSKMTLIYDQEKRIQEWPARVRVRGNFSATHENKPYRFKIEDGRSHRIFEGSTAEQSPARAKKWTLINSYGDKTLIRNNVAYEVSRRVGMTFTPYCQNVDLILNGEYRGTYQLTDWLGSDPQRIPLTDMMPSDTIGELLTGGYFFEMNGYAKSDPVHFISKHGNPVTVHNPDDKQIQPQQFKYLQGWFNGMEDRLFGSDYTHPTRGYRSHLDVESFLKYFLANEFSGNTDMLWQVYMWKQRMDSLIYTGPVWDNDLALDNDFNVFPGNKRQEWTYKVRCAGQWRQVVDRVLSDKSALERLREIWAERRDAGHFEANDLAAYVDSLRHLVNASQQLNFRRWPYLLQKVHCNPQVWGSWDAEVDVVRNYVVERIQWMDRKLGYNQPLLVDGIYQVSTANQLAAISRMVKAGDTRLRFALTADIDMRTLKEPFSPIGELDHQFEGTCYGQGHTISHLNIEGENFVALFGVVAGEASISGIMLDSTCHIKGQKYVAGLIGAARGDNTQIEACGFAGKVTAQGEYAGGLLGGAPTGNVVLSHCFCHGQVYGATKTGSLLGFAKRAELRHCYSTGESQSRLGKYMMANATELKLTNCYDLHSGWGTCTTPSEVASGALCWLLNEGKVGQWRQNLLSENDLTQADEQPLPSTDHAPVYRTTDGRYTNTNPYAPHYRYYMWVVEAVKDADAIQVSEFSLIDENENEIPGLTAYKGICHYFNGEGWTNLTDGDTHTKWCGKLQPPAIVFFDAKEIVTPAGYRICTANDTEHYPQRNPVTWKLYGARWKLTNWQDPRWHLLDEQTNNHSIEAVNYAPFHFLFSSKDTGIDSLPHDESVGRTPWHTFDLMGKPATHTQKGIYIRNGKKILIKNKQ